MPTRVFRNVVKDLSTEEPAPAPLSGFGFAGMAGLLLGHRESHGLSFEKYTVDPSSRTNELFINLVLLKQNA